MKKSILLSAVMCGFFSYSATWGMMICNLPLNLNCININKSSIHALKNNKNIFNNVPDSDNNSVTTQCTSSSSTNFSSNKFSVFSGNSGKIFSPSGSSSNQFTNASIQTFLESFKQGSTVNTINGDGLFGGNNNNDNCMGTFDQAIPQQHKEIEEVTISVNNPKTPNVNNNTEAPSHFNTENQRKLFTRNTSNAITNIIEEKIISIPGGLKKCISANSGRNSGNNRTNNSTISCGNKITITNPRTNIYRKKIIYSYNNNKTTPTKKKNPPKSQEIKIDITKLRFTQPTKSLFIGTKNTDHKKSDATEMGSISSQSSARSSTIISSVANSSLVNRNLSNAFNEVAKEDGKKFCPILEKTISLRGGANRSKQLGNFGSKMETKKTTEQNKMRGVTIKANQLISQNMSKRSKMMVKKEFRYCNEQKIYKKKQSTVRMNTITAKTTIMNKNNDIPVKRIYKKKIIGTNRSCFSKFVNDAEYFDNESPKYLSAQWIKKLEKADKVYKIADCLKELLQLDNKTSSFLSVASDKIKTWNGQSMRNKYKEAKNTKNAILELLLKDTNEKTKQASLATQS